MMPDMKMKRVWELIIPRDLESKYGTGSSCLQELIAQRRDRSPQKMKTQSLGVQPCAVPTRLSSDGSSHAGSITQGLGTG